MLLDRGPDHPQRGASFGIVLHDRFEHAADVKVPEPFQRKLIESRVAGQFMRLKFIPPMKPKLVAKPPGGDGWIHEIKLDGYRTQIVIDGPGDVTVFSSSGADWTRKYAGIAEAAREIDVESAIIDGEVVVTDAAGLPDFNALQRVIHTDPYAMIFCAFDILHLNGRDLRDIGCKARREMLFGIIKPQSRIQFSEALPGDAASIFYLVGQAGLEGVVSKRADSNYRSGPSSSWVKAKTWKRRPSR